MSGCDCHFEVRDAEQRRVLLRLLAINGAMFAVEMFVGILAHSTGVMADSLDMLADAFVYGIGLYAVGRSEDSKYQAARWSGFFQIILAVSILFDVVRRARQGSEPNSILMMGVSVVALVANAYCLKLLQKHRDGEVHMRASWIFSRSDVIANAGVILAGVMVAVTNSAWPDLIVGFAIALVVLNGGRAILRNARRSQLQ